MGVGLGYAAMRLPTWVAMARNRPLAIGCGGAVGAVQYPLEQPPQLELVQPPPVEHDPQLPWPQMLWSQQASGE